jgi:hypothetical protein
MTAPEPSETGDPGEPRSSGGPMAADLMGAGFAGARVGPVPAATGLRKAAAKRVVETVLPGTG